MASSRFTLEQFLKSRIKDREAIRKACARIDAFRKKHGQPEVGFDSVKILRQLREAR